MTKTALIAAPLGILWWGVVVAVGLLTGATIDVAVVVAAFLGPMGGAIIGWQIGIRVGTRSA